MVKVYAYTCRSTGRAYVGITSGKLSKRAREHKCMAKAGTHHSKRLSEEWKTYGDDFDMVCLETLSPDATLIQRREAELRWLKTYEERGLLLNAAVVSYSPTPEAIRKGVEASRTVAGNWWTPEANEKRRQAQLGIPKGHGAKISATKQARNRERNG